MANRQYEPFTLFNIRIVDMRHLWTPSTEYKGQQQKPNYFAGFLIQKTQAQWSNEPALAGLTQAYGKLYANNPQLQDWRIQDGDVPSPDGKSSEFAKGHWLFNASSSQPITVEIAQANGAAPAKLQSRVNVKPGDYCVIGGSAVVSGQNNRSVKLYLNAVVFTAPGEEIVFANSVSGAELMQQAQKQGLQVAGFSGSTGFAAPGGGMGFTGGASSGGSVLGSAPQGQPFGQGNGQTAAFPSSAAPLANPFAPK